MALEQSRAGNLPTLLKSITTSDRLTTQERWSVGSRVTAGQVYLIDLHADGDGISTICSCAAAEAQRLCWHRAACRMAALGEVDYHDATTVTPSAKPTPKLSAEDLSGPRFDEPASDDVTAWAAVS
jgi:hypothetical protein